MAEHYRKNKLEVKAKKNMDLPMGTYEQNEEMDRQLTLIITAGDLQESITLFQTGVARDWWDGSTSIDDLIVKPQN